MSTFLTAKLVNTHPFDLHDFSHDQMAADVLIWLLPLGALFLGSIGLFHLRLDQYLKIIYCI
jgi:hypothetical protein